MADAVELEEERAGGAGRPAAPRSGLRRPASRASRRPYASSSRTASAVLVADEVADITAAMTTAVAG